MFGNTAPAWSLCNGNDALQSLGGHHASFIQPGSLQWYDSVVNLQVNVIDSISTLEIPNYWALLVTQHLIGNESQPLSKTASGAGFDYASFGRGAPVSVNSYARLVQLTEATLDISIAPNNGTQSFYSVPCAKASQLPSLKHQVGAGTPELEIFAQNFGRQRVDH